MHERKHQSDIRDDLSDAASSHADVRTLNDEPLPSYNEVPSSSIEQRPSENTVLPMHNTPASDQDSSREQGPTVADPFTFPSRGLPSYTVTEIIQRPLAIPQTTPSAAAPFLLAYPTALLSFGITMESWKSFVRTLSAFLSAKVSQQAIHHAADIASHIGDFHKQYVSRAKEGFKNIGKSVKRFSPVGVVSGAIGITVGAAGHVVGTVFQAAGSLAKKPQTPRERASVYVTTANGDWFHSRGLHAVLMDTVELSRLCEVNVQNMLSAVSSCGSKDPGSQLASLREIIGEVKVEQDVQSDAIPKQSSANSSKAAEKRSAVTQLQLDSTTLWLVLVPKQDDAVPSVKAPIQVNQH
ncbi:uncharacterized protein RCC_07261 [Ramularia collo-cygni]|uniref:Uncharacterized protein n=1 Tax=Ramularia collo-cygni TaxID=112498 RepID=A0A2D3V0U7_9PEZI|nr:uncharacterized protein RCC_07261 [Ramularia collo-cygni]CZT21398.1 uncharacterized protein RCC_07261 [Ramularia collo-cygni]